jgi:hypothetical protein
MNIVSKKSTLMSLVLAGLVIGSMPMTVKAANPKIDVKTFLTNQKWYIVAGLVASFITCCKEAVAKPQTVTGDDVKKLAQLQDLLTSEYWENVVHLINNGILGQVGIRGKAVLGITNEEDGSMAFREVNALPSTGIVGNTLFLAKLVAKKAKDVTNLLVLPGLIGLMVTNADHVAKGEYDKAEVVR